MAHEVLKPYTHETGQKISYVKIVIKENGVPEVMEKSLNILLTKDDGIVIEGDYKPFLFITRAQKGTAYDTKLNDPSVHFWDFSRQKELNGYMYSFLPMPKAKARLLKAMSKYVQKNLSVHNNFADKLSKI